MNANENARQLLFRTLMGEEPLPKIEEIVAARSQLANDHAAQATLDELLAVITHAEQTAPGAWHDLLHRYAAAQLTGRGDTAEFAAVRRLLDGNVALAEEYALLYETLRAEATGQLPCLTEIPQADLNFLPRPAPVRGLARLLPKRYPPAGLLQIFQQMGRVQQLATAAAIALVFFISAWATEFTWQRSAIVDNAPDQPVISTAVSHSDPRSLEESLKGWSSTNSTHPIFVENQSITSCSEAISADARKECPM